MNRSAVVSVLIFFIFQASSAVSETWKINSLEWPPYSGAELDGQGTAIVELRNLLSHGGIKLEVSFLPWTRAQTTTKQYGSVGYFPAWPEEVRKGFIASNGIAGSYINVIHTQDSDLVWGSMMNLFHNYRVGLVESYVYPDAIEAASKRYPFNVVLAPQEESLIKMLSAGRMDAVLTDANVSMYYAKKLKLKNIRKSGREVDEKPLVVAFENNEYAKGRVNILNQLIEKYGSFQTQ